MGDGLDDGEAVGTGVDDGGAVGSGVDDDELVKAGLAAINPKAKGARSIEVALRLIFDMFPLGVGSPFSGAHTI